MFRISVRTAHGGLAASLVPVRSMTTRRVSIRVPARPPLATALSVSALLSVGLLAGCTSTEDTWGSPTADPERGGVTVTDGSDGELAQDGMIFRQAGPAADRLDGGGFVDGDQVAFAIDSQ